MVTPFRNNIKSIKDTQNKKQWMHGYFKNLGSILLTRKTLKWRSHLLEKCVNALTEWKKYKKGELLDWKEEKLRFNYVGFWFVIVRYFALLKNCVTLSLQKEAFLINSDISHVLTAYGNYVILTLRFGVSIYGIFLYVIITL